MEIIEARVKRLSDILRETDRKRWIAKVAAAEAAAARGPDAKLLHYRISYRLSAKASGTDTYGHRSQALTDIIRSIEGEHHVATSTWDVSLHIASAAVLTELLSPSLDPSLDALRVVQVSKRNRGSFGVNELES